MSKPKVEIYTTKSCPYCDRAKRFFEQKGIIYQNIDISGNSDLRDIMVKRAGGRTSVPQIFINDHHVGGSDDLYTLDHSGKLDSLLGRL
jgi:glutaredoxin 3